MKYYKRLKIYKASNVTFNPETFEAKSYDWWVFVAKVNGYVVFNDYVYSMSTRKHQNKLRRLLSELGIKIDLEIRTKESLNAYFAKQKALENAYWHQDFETVKKIKQVYKIRLTRDEIQAIYDRKEEQLCNAYLERAFQYQEKKTEEQKKAEHDKKFHKTVMEIVNHV